MGNQGGVPSSLLDPDLAPLGLRGASLPAMADASVSARKESCDRADSALPDRGSRGRLRRIVRGGISTALEAANVRSALQRDVREHRRISEFARAPTRHHLPSQFLSL